MTASAQQTFSIFSQGSWSWNSDTQWTDFPASGNAIDKTRK